MNFGDKLRKSLSISRLVSILPHLISPIAWWHCFNLLYNPFADERTSPTKLLRFSNRISLKSLMYVFLHLILLLLVGLWCYLFWTLIFDAGQYLRLLSNVSSNRTNITDGRSKYGQLLWRTALKTIFIAVDFGLINACAVNLAALWRERLCIQFYRIIFGSVNGCLLYATAQQPAYDLPTRLTNDIRQFTSHLSISLFGSLFYSGILAVSIAVIMSSIYVVQKTNGDTMGIAFCFSAFALCVLLSGLVSYKFNRIVIEQLKSKGKIRSFLQRLQTSAECLAFYASARQCELVSYFKLNQLVHRWNVRAAICYAFVNVPISLMDSLDSFATYILPSVLFLFLRQNEDQTPESARKYLGIIAFYGYIFWLLVSLLWISESCLIAVTLGEHLWNLKERLLRLQAFHQHRLEHEQVAKIRLESSDLCQFVQLRIIVPDESEQRVLQSNINFDARRGESVLINGPTGCGKTSLFRVCAGLWPIDAKLVRLPARKETIYIPQRPYLPIGSLRFQVLFLLQIRAPNQSSLNITDQQIRDLFELVNMNYLLDRYDLDTIVEWPAELSVGEQQRLAFIRLFALFKYCPDEIMKTLVMFDESTSAVDTNTEAIIYQLLNKLQIWFVTISHRPSLIQYHQKELKLYSSNANNQQNAVVVNHKDNVIMDFTRKESVATASMDESTTDQGELPNLSTDNTKIEYIDLIKSGNVLKEIRNIWRVVHLPFGSKSRSLRIQTYVTWFICLLFIGAYCYLSFRLTIQTGAIFQVLPDYAASSIDINEGRSRIGQLIWRFLLLIAGLIALYSIQIGIGQLLGALYTCRQSLYLSRLLLDDEENEYTLYHTVNLKLLPNIISHDLAELNVQLFYLLTGSIYFNGIIGIVIQCVIFTILLAQESGSTKGVLIVYGYQFFISSLILSVIKPYYHKNVQFENNFALLSNAQKRIDLQGEQIALSDHCVMDIERTHLQSKLDASVRAQTYSGFFYGLLVASSVLGNWSSTIVNYAIPSLIFFYLTPNPTVSQAASIIALTVYTRRLQYTLTAFNSYGQPFSQVWTIGRRIAQNFEQLVALRQLHREFRSSEFSSDRRIEINPTDRIESASLILNNVNVCIPSSPSTILIRSLTFSLKSPESLIITGASGCGKSSLIRLLAGLQYNLTDHSSICLPSRSSIIFIPQQLYLIEGTLREQLNYFRYARNMSTYTDDQHIKDLLTKFNLIHLMDRYTLDSSVHLWSRTLSLGEQQRLIIVVALLTLLQTTDPNQPIKYLILDETTAGCDQLTEKIIYESLQNSHVQYISISHRNELIKYHTHQLIINSKTHSYELIQHF